MRWPNIATTVDIAVDMAVDTAVDITAEEAALQLGSLVPAARSPMAMGIMVVRFMVAVLEALSMAADIQLTVVAGVMVADAEVVAEAEVSS